jgi:hypothetical protein
LNGKAERLQGVNELSNVGRRRSACNHGVSKQKLSRVAHCRGSHSGYSRNSTEILPH